MRLQRCEENKTRGPGSRLSGARRAPAADQPTTVADLIVSGGPILTLGEPATVEAIAVGDGRILAMGDRDEVARLRGPDTADYDLAGRVLAPAFVDHHVHLLNLGFALLYRAEPSPAFVDLAGLDSLAAIGDRIEASATALPEGAWILGQSWSQGAWGASALPTNEVLSTAAPAHPVFLTRVDGHAGWANERGPGGSRNRRHDGRPSGRRHPTGTGRNAQRSVARARQRTRCDRRCPSRRRPISGAPFVSRRKRWLAQGVTEVFDAGFLGLPGVVDLSLDFETYMALLVEADLESPLPLRVHLMVPAPSPLFERITADPEAYRRLTPRIGVTHVKLFADGALGSRGALLSHPYADDPTTSGVERMSREDIRREAVAALDAGFDVATHAIGDVAVEMALDVYEEILLERPELRPGRLRIEHFSYAAPADFDRAAALGIVLAVNPDFVAPGRPRPGDGGRAGGRRQE